MKIYRIYKIQNHFKIFYNFNTHKFDVYKNNLKSNNFCSSYIYASKIEKSINKKENCKDWGNAKFCYIEYILINKNKNK